LTAVPSFEFALRERTARLMNFRHAYYARVRRVDRLPGGGGLAIVFDHVDPRRKMELKNRVVVRTEGKNYPLANAHFESVSRESTVQKKTEKRGTSETTVVSRERDEEMRVVVDVDRKPTNIVLYSARGPVTICEEEVEISLPGDDDLEVPVS